MQDAQLKSIKSDHAEYGALHFHLLQDAVARCDLAFQAFFRRVKVGESPGFPRFKGRGQYESFTFKDAVHRNGAALCAGGKRLRIHGIGNVKIKLHREHSGKLKQVRVLRRADGWYAQFVCVNVPVKPLPVTGRELGIDVGVKVFAAFSEGEPVKNPRHYETGQEALAAAQRKLSGRKKGSKRRRKQVKLVAKAHLRVARQRRDGHHKLALKLVKENDFLVAEDLNVKGLVRGFLSKQISDAGWSQFLSILAYKAESAGRELMLVDPRGTSQNCSSCGECVPKDLSIRVHHCVSCGYTADRDVNAAKNILRLGQSLREARGHTA